MEHVGTYEILIRVRIERREHPCASTQRIETAVDGEMREDPQPPVTELQARLLVLLVPSQYVFDLHIWEQYPVGW